MNAKARPFLIDLHVHTTLFSFDSGLQPDDAVERAKAMGLSGICLTEHNAVWPRELARALSSRLEFPVFRGMEVSTDAGHVLVIGLDAHSSEMASVDRLRRIVESQGAAMVLAHPMREPAYPGPWSEVPSLFDGLEVMNADDSLHTRRVIGRIAADLGLVAVGGSDAHTAAAVGRCATAFDREIASEAELAAALRAGMARPVALEGQAAAKRPPR